MHGKIKWLNTDKSYGCIKPYDASRDMSFHNVSTLPPDNVVPEPGLRVEYDEDSETDLDGRSVASDVRAIK